MSVTGRHVHDGAAHQFADLLADFRRPASRRGHDLPQGSVDGNRQLEPSSLPKSRAKKAGASDRAGSVMPGQERPILVSHEAVLTPAASKREFRLSRPAVHHVITVAQRGRRKKGAIDDPIRQVDKPSSEFETGRLRDKDGCRHSPGSSLDRV